MHGSVHSAGRTKESTRAYVDDYEMLFMLTTDEPDDANQDTGERGNAPPASTGVHRDVHPRGEKTIGDNKVHNGTDEIDDKITMPGRNSKSVDLRGDAHFTVGLRGSAHPTADVHRNMYPGEGLRGHTHPSEDLRGSMHSSEDSNDYLHGHLYDQHFTVHSGLFHNHYYNVHIHHCVHYYTHYHIHHHSHYYVHYHIHCPVHYYTHYHTYYYVHYYIMNVQFSVPSTTSDNVATSRTISMVTMSMVVFGEEALVCMETCTQDQVCMDLVYTCTRYSPMNLVMHGNVHPSLMCMEIFTYLSVPMSR